MKTKFLTKEIITSLSPFETVIVKSMKSKINYDVKKIYKLVRRRKKISKSSVSVLLDRLYKKGLVNRRVDSSSNKLKFLYRIEINKRHYEKELIDNIIKSAVQKFGSKAITYFHENLKNIENTKRRR